MTSKNHPANKLAIVIATKDRPVEVKRLLRSIKGQSLQPSQIVLVDGSDDPVEDVVTQIPGISVKYVRVYPPALTKQKNVGVTAVDQDINLIGFVDDDVVFADGAIEAMMSFWEGAPENQGGASFNLTDYDLHKSWLGSLPKRLFFIDDREFGRVLRSGFNTPIWDTKEDRASGWLGGGYTVWRKQVFDQWKFSEWFTGSGLWEDVFFSHRVAKHYRLSVVAGAGAKPLEVPLTNRQQVRVGRTQVVNWVYFVKSNQDLSIAMCLWACIGRTTINLAKGLVKREPGLIFRSLGNSIGLAAAILGTLNPMPSKEARN